MSQERGKFVVYEGGVGAGKSSQLDLLLSNLNRDSWTLTREPGGTIFGEKMRDLVQGRESKDLLIDPYAALFAYSSARANLIRGAVLPQINSGKNVLQDRYWYSTFAYQGAEGVSRPVIWLVSMIATAGLKPTVVIHYDLAPEVGIKRKEGQEDIDRYDLAKLEFHRKVRANYHLLRKIYPGIWRTIDASQSIGEVFGDTKKVLRDFGIMI